MSISKEEIQEQIDALTSVTHGALLAGADMGGCSAFAKEAQNIKEIINDAIYTLTLFRQGVEVSIS